MATPEFEPYSFEPMRNKDKASEGEEPRGGNATSAVVTFADKLGRASRKRMFMFRPGNQ